MGDIVITGLGIVSALGQGIDKTVERLLSEESAVGKIRYLQTRHDNLPAGEVPYSDAQMREMLGIAPDYNITRTSLLGQLALKEALQQANLNDKCNGVSVLVAGNTVGGMEKSEQYYHHFLNDEQYKDYIGLHDCGACTEMIAQAAGFQFNLITTISTACSSAANSIMMGADLLRTGRADIVVAGGTECLSKFHLNGFNTLMILDNDVCKPFDKSRCGLNLGEGAAFIVMETAESAQQRGAAPICRLSGYANRCDAFHQTASSPNGQGAFLAMTGALADASLKPDDIDYVNAHGTGTPNNDESEGQAMMRVFGDKIPPISSTKAFTGHTTSASGAIEAVISILCISRNFIPVNLNFSEKIESLNFIPVTKTMKGVNLKHVLTNSFGFGGNDSSCIFSKIE